MDKKELEKGMEKALEDSGKDGKESKDAGGESAPEGMEEAAAAWAPSMDWLMGSLGPFFNNNRGLGELLLDKLNESGIDTEGVALAGLVDVLQQFSREYKALGEAVGDNLDRINSLSSQSENLADAVKDLLREMGTPQENAADFPADAQLGGAESGGGDMNASQEPQPSMDAGGAPDMGGGMPPDMGGGMPPDMGAGAGAGAGAGTVSDEELKEVKRGVLSDARLKRTARSMVGEWRRNRAKEKSSTRLGSNIIGACREVGDAGH